MVVGLDDLVVAVATKATSVAVTKLLGELLGRQERMLVLLTQTHQDVGALLHGPLRTATSYLSEAAEPDRSPALRRGSLELARAEFMRALGQEHDPFLRSEAALGLSLTWLGLGGSADSIRHAETAARQLFIGIDTSIREVGAKQRSRSRWWGSMSRLALGRGEVLRLVEHYTDLCLRQHELVRMARNLGSKGAFQMSALSVGVWQQNIATRTVIPVVDPSAPEVHPLPSLPGGLDASYDLIGGDSATALRLHLPWRGGL